MNASNSADITTPNQTRASPRKFYVFGPDVTGGGKGHGLVFVNEEKLLTPPRLIVQPAEGGFPVLKEKPHIAFDPRKGNPPGDLEASLSGYWFISERLKQVFETVDPEGFAFAECDYTLPDGSRGPTHYLCDVVRTLDALDEEKSKLNIEVGDYVNGKYYDLTGGASLVFQENVIGNARIFKMPFSAKYFCDSTLYNACNEIPELKGLWFIDASDY